MLNELIIPASALAVVRQYEGSSGQLGHFLKSQVWDTDHLPDIAILGIPEARGSHFHQIAGGPDAIRVHLYSLTSFSHEIKIVDLGNIKCGTELKDTYAALQIVAEELSGMNIRLLLLGGSQDLTVPLIKGFKRQEFSLVVVDDRIDNSTDEYCATDEYFLNDIPAGTSVNIIAGQSYFISQQQLDMVAGSDDLEIMTLGEIRSDIKEIEPLLRKCDLVSFDFGAIKASEAPGQYRVSPNGLSGEEACQIAWYSGISTTQSWFGIFGYSPSDDLTTTGAMMAAQIGWYYFNGISKRLDAEPFEEAANFEHYHIKVDVLEDPISFLLHPVSKRWWMEVPSEDCALFPVRIPCSKKDYVKACKNEISEKWWKYFFKI